MPRAQVGVLGYGVIGKRVADAVRRQPDMEVAGVAIQAGSPSLAIARALGYRVFEASTETTDDPLAETQGTLPELLERIDVLLDCTPSSVPMRYRALYDAHPELPIIVQGGESHSFGGVSFNTFANYADAFGHKRVRVISCSSTGSTRLLWGLQQAFGLEEAFISLWRRAADPGKRSKTPLNALAPVLGQSHHAPDVQTVLPGLQLYSMSADCPTTLGHVLTVQADLARYVNRQQVLDVLDQTPRVIVGEGLRSTADLAEYFQDLGRSRRDRPEIYVWSEGLHVSGRTLVVTFSVHMESITIPETIDCVRAVLGLERNGWASAWTTDHALGIAKETSCYPPFPL
jgi:glyceraldehyde-3-phosphate dehydrogenase (NAD(P))